MKFNRIQSCLATVSAVAVFTSIANAAVIPCGTFGITVDNGQIFVTPATTADNEGAASTTAVTDSATGVQVQLGGYWTTWKSVSGYTYGDIGAIMAVGSGNTGTITLTAPTGFKVTLVSFDAIGTNEPGHGPNILPTLSITATNPAGNQNLDNLSVNSPTHNTQLVNLTGETITLSYANPNGDYGSQGINNLVYSVSPVPEPASLGIFGLGSVAGSLLMFRRWLKKQPVA